MELSDLKPDVRICGKYQKELSYLITCVGDTYIEVFELGGDNRKTYWKWLRMDMYYVLMNFELAPEDQFAKDLEDIINE